jgi:hypothetical protein
MVEERSLAAEDDDEAEDDDDSLDHMSSMTEAEASEITPAHGQVYREAR